MSKDGGTTLIWYGITLLLIAWLVEVLQLQAAKTGEAPQWTAGEHVFFTAAATVAGIALISYGIKSSRK